ncbi:hypothetical protein ES705_09307 [subsurface metagenome]
MRSLWDHSYRTAFYAYHMARSFKKKKDILDDIYVGGILHDLGKIIIATLHPELLDRIISFCAEKEIPTRMLEDLSVGFNHAEIGAMIAEKWNFPEQLVAAIRLHHEPNETDEKFADVVYTVYLANALTAIEREQISFEQIDKDVLNAFGIQTADHLAKIQERLDKAFLRQRSNF